MNGRIYDPVLARFMTADPFVDSPTDLQSFNRCSKCCFHEDDQASLVVTPAKNLWHCFGCGAGGGPIDWVMKARGVSFRHAVELLSRKRCWVLGNWLMRSMWRWSLGVGPRLAGVSCAPISASTETPMLN